MNKDKNWQILGDKHNNKLLSVVNASNGHAVCRLWRENVRERFKECEENAKLIAAAPDLLSLCEHLYMELPKYDLNPEDLERLSVPLENSILNAGGKLPPQ